MLRHIWYAAEAVYRASNKIMATNWKMYITISQKYSTELKKNIINDDPIKFVCTELKTIITSFNNKDEAKLKLSTYMMNVLVKLCSHGHMVKSHNILVEFILFLNRYLCNYEYTHIKPINIQIIIDDNNFDLSAYTVTFIIS